MSIGNKLIELRKKEGLSQEQVAEKLNVSRQTISKWELDETSPDLKSAKALSQLYQVSLDELVDNDVHSLVIEKVSNTEKLAGIIIKILKWIGILMIVWFILMIIAIFSFGFLRHSNSEEIIYEYAQMGCNTSEKDYLLELDTDGNFNCVDCDAKLQMDLLDRIDFSDMNTSINEIEDYFIEAGGGCNIRESGQTISLE